MERISALLNPMDYLLWLSEELETRDWNSDVVGTQLGLGMNFLLLLCRANTGGSAPSDDIFRDDSSSGWVSFFVSLLLLLALAPADPILLDSTPCLASRLLLVFERLLHTHSHSQVPAIRG